MEVSFYGDQGCTSPRGWASIAENVATYATRPARASKGAKGALVAAVVGGLACVEGGYFPTAWGWSALVLAWVVSAALVLRDPWLDRGQLWIVAGFVALLGYVTLTNVWSQSNTATMLEVERTALYVVAVLAFVVLAQRGAAGQLLGGAAVAVAGVSVYALATRLFPASLGVIDPTAVYRLAEPVGYWNALGVLAALGALLCVAFALTDARLLTRSLAAAALPVLFSTIYFTYSRGAWIAFCIGLAAMFAVSPRRLGLITTAAVVIAPAALAVWLASRADALTHESSSLADAASQGRRVAVGVAVLAATSVALVAVIAKVRRRLHLPPLARRGLAGALTATALVIVSVFVVRLGGPVGVAHKVFEGVKAPPVQVDRPGSSLNRRLFDLSSNGRLDMWDVALANFRYKPVLGSGAGTFEELWLRDRPVALTVRDAHSLYLETLAELGLVGLALLLGVLSVPLMRGFSARGQPFVPAALGAYVVFLVHAAVDWDWEVPAVTVTGLACGTAVLAAAQCPSPNRRLSSKTRVALLAGTLALAAVALVGLIGNNALSSARTAFFDHRWADGERDARSARRWAPWSAAPVELLAELQLAQGNIVAARSSFRLAIRKSSRDWNLWFEYAQVTDGRTRKRALAEARRLNPLDAEITR